LQTNHLYRSWRYPLGRPTVLREVDALQAVASLGIMVPGLVYAGEQRSQDGWRAVLVTRDLAGYRDLARWGLRRSKGKISDQRHAEMIAALGKMLGTLHRHRWQHTNLYPNHIFTTHDDAEGPVKVALIDLENSRLTISAKLAAHRDLEQLHKRANMFSAGDWQQLLDAHAVAMR
jgi:tRNA A-37 threonylcarbamoyl transferase component Bud32